MAGKIENLEALKEVLLKKKPNAVWINLKLGTGLAINTSNKWYGDAPKKGCTLLFQSDDAFNSTIKRSYEHKLRYEPDKIEKYKDMFATSYKQAYPGKQFEPLKNRRELEAAVLDANNWVEKTSSVRVSDANKLTKGLDEYIGYVKIV